MIFSHLHCHTQFSLLDGAASISSMVKKAKNDGMPAVAITDHGNMFGAFQFVAEAGKHGVKPIVGCEFYLVNDRHIKNFSKEQRDNRHHQLLLAKNADGYKNLTKLCSLGYIEGFYGKYPRIDKELVLKYHEGLIATTCCIGAEVPQAILNQGVEAAEEKFKWWLDLFGEDYYIELQRHDLKEQIEVNEVLLKFAKKYNVKVIASNDSHYVDKEDSNAHDILLCVNTGEFKSTPVGDGKGYRFGFPNEEFYFKTTSEMEKTFHDLPHALDNTNEIVDKIDHLKLKKDILLPNFPIPAGFTDGDHYLRHITYEGAKRKYNGLALNAIIKDGDSLPIPSEVTERLEFELLTIKTMGFAGYFLIVADFIQAGRDLGVMVGPGRGSAAGSAVAYSVGITNIDPIKYNLLFERFLNPDRKSMPDIDTDFDDAGRQKVIDYVVQKYGRNQVAQIVTYGTMATKSAIKDVARVMELPLADATNLTKMVPDKPTYGMDFQKLVHMDLSELSKIIGAEEMDNVKKIREMYKGNDLISNVLREAEKLEGNIRNTGVHAAGIIIAPGDLTEILPVCTSKDTDLLITQFEGKIIEDAGVLKMDFLGLRNLSIIKDCLQLIQKNHGITIEIDNIPLDDPLVFELFQRGEMNAIFQFESEGMKMYMRELKPDRFDDLIAMNALYRPGPLAYIPNFINRKHGREPIKYDLPEMEEYLSDTYGITVYQEQVMLLSQKLANFTKGDADTLRKAMGKKQKEVLDKMKSKFMDGCQKNGHELKICEKIWIDWEAFASYAFNKSHSTCYAFVAYQTAYLKAHYPAEYMSAVLTSSMGNIEKITFFMDECKRMGLPVLGPDVNESDEFFSVTYKTDSPVFEINTNGSQALYPDLVAEDSAPYQTLNNQRKGVIRFGMGAIKGTGDAAVNSIMEERQKNGRFKDFWDFVKRVNLRTVNKKTFESLAYAGAFDSFEYHRAMYFCPQPPENISLIEKAIKYGNTYHAEKSSSQNSLFGGTSFMEVPVPKPYDGEKWSEIEKLKYENEVVGFYISGHPLDTYKLEIDTFCTSTVDKVLENYKNKDVSVAGVVTKAVIRTTKTGNQFALFTIQDYQSSIDLALFGEDFLKMGHMIVEGQYVFVKGKVMTRWQSSDQWELKINSIQLLSEIRFKLTKGININLNVKHIDKKILSDLSEKVKEYPGDCTLKVLLVDEDEKIKVETFSRTVRISPEAELFNELKTMSGVTFELVK